MPLIRFAVLMLKIVRPRLMGPERLVPGITITLPVYIFMAKITLPDAGLGCVLPNLM